MKKLLKILEPLNTFLKIVGSFICVMLILYLIVGFKIFGKFNELKMSDVIYHIVSLLGLIVTACFSYVIYRTGEKSLKLENFNKIENFNEQLGALEFYKNILTQWKDRVKISKGRAEDLLDYVNFIGGYKYFGGDFLTDYTKDNYVKYSEKIIHLHLNDDLFKILECIEIMEKTIIDGINCCEEKQKIKQELILFVENYFERIPELREKNIILNLEFSFLNNHIDIAENHNQALLELLNSLDQHKQEFVSLIGGTQYKKHLWKISMLYSYRHSLLNLFTLKESETISIMSYDELEKKIIKLLDAIEKNIQTVNMKLEGITDDEI